MMHMMHIRLSTTRNGLRVLGVIALVVLLSAGASAQPARLSVAYTGVGPTHLPVWIAKETGIFARNGLDVQVVRAQAAVATMSLISGEVGFIQAAAPAVVLSNLGGSGTVYVASGYVGLDYWLVSTAKRKGVSRAARCFHFSYTDCASASRSWRLRSSVI